MLRDEPYSENPFTPTFGEVPAYMAGRSMLLQEFKRAFGSQKRHPSLTAAITGARGTGKTALLSLLADEAEQRGWIAVRTVALEGMLDDILISARRATAHIVDHQKQSFLTGLELGQLVGIEWEHTQKLTNWRNEMAGLLDKLNSQNIGLIITVDEVQPKLDEMVRLAAIYQIFVTEGRKVSLLMAGLPHNILQLEKDKSVSFLRRAQRYELGRIANYDIKDAMQKTIVESGRLIDDQALDEAALASDGFPFLMQLVGFRMWDQHIDRKVISVEDARNGIQLALAEMRDRIVKTTYDSLSAGDRAFLIAMTLDQEASSIPDIAQRLEKSISYATQYKTRLLGQGVIAEQGDGCVRFELPLMREYVSERIVL